MNKKHTVKEILRFINSSRLDEKEKLYYVFSKLRHFPPIERFIFLLQHIINTRNIIEKYNIATSFLLKKKLEYSEPEDLSYMVEDIEAPTFLSENDPRLLVLAESEMYIIQQELNDYNTLLINELTNVSEIIFNIYYLNDVMLHTSSFSPIINKDIFILSPIFLSKKNWELLVLYELEILKNESIVKATINKLKHILIDLRYRLNFDKIPYIDFFQFLPNVDNLSIIHQLPPIDISFFKYKIEKYISFLENIDTTKVNKQSLQRLQKQIKSESNKRRVLEKELKKSKITLNNSKSIKKIKKGLVYLLKKTNPNIDNTTLEKTAIIIIQSLFHTPSSFQIIFEIPYQVVVDKNILIDFVLFLNKNNYFDNTRISIPFILSKRFPSIINYSTSQLYNLLNKNRIYLFKGVSSEIALKNEMNY